MHFNFSHACKTFKIKCNLKEKNLKVEIVFRVRAKSPSQVCSILALGHTLRRDQRELGVII